MFDAIRRAFNPFHDSVEAIEWLDNNKNDCAFASNRFHSTGYAKCFIQELYEAGAITVAIPRESILSEPWRIEQYGGPYADTILVKLPKEPEKRHALWQICDAEYRRENKDDWPEYDPSYIPSRGHIDLWWD